MRPREAAHADDVDVLLDGGAGDHLGGLPEPRVDDLEPGVPERPGDDLGPAVVPIEPRLGDQHPNLPLRTHGFHILKAVQVSTSLGGSRKALLDGGDVPLEGLDPPGKLVVLVPSHNSLPETISALTQHIQARS